MNNETLSSLLSDLPEHLLVELSEGVLSINLNRPQQRNALSASLTEDLLKLFEGLSRCSPEVRVITLRGVGGNFCAGGDVRDMKDATPDELKRLNRHFGTLLEHIMNSPIPVICILEGAVMGGGLGLASVGDVCVALTSVSLRLPEVRLGLIPAQVIPFLVRKIGASATRRLALTGDLLTPQRALALGLIDELCEDEGEQELIVRALISSFKKGGPRALALTKRLLNQSVGKDDTEVSHVLDEASELFVKQREGEAREGLAAFMERRSPRW